MSEQYLCFDGDKEGYLKVWVEVMFWIRWPGGVFLRRWYKRTSSVGVLGSSIQGRGSSKYKDPEAMCVCSCLQSSKEGSVVGAEYMRASILRSEVRDVGEWRQVELCRPLQELCFDLRWDPSEVGNRKVTSSNLQVVSITLISVLGEDWRGQKESRESSCETMEVLQVRKAGDLDQESIYWGSIVGWMWWQGAREKVGKMWFSAFYLSKKVEEGTTADVRFGVGAGNLESHLEKCVRSTSGDVGGREVVGTQPLL